MDHEVLDGFKTIRVLKQLLMQKNMSLPTVMSIMQLNSTTLQILVRPIQMPHFLLLNHRDNYICGLSGGIVLKFDRR
jgi:hypothetical protein